MNLKDKYPGADEDQIDLLNKMLQINPYFRVSVEDALSHPCFTKIRKQPKESIAENPVTIDFEDDPLDKEMLRQLFLRMCGEIQSDSDFRK